MARRRSTPAPAAVMAQPPGVRRAVWLLLLVLALAAYLPALRNGFAYDDRRVIADAEYLLAHPSLASKLLSAEYFALSGESTYRPVLTLTYMIDRAAGSGAAWAFHLQNVLWHVASVALIYALLVRLGSGAGAAAAAAAIFAVHPALTEAVDSISFREDVLAAALGLMAFVLVSGGEQPARIGRSLLTGAVLLLAQLAKESAFAFVLLIPITLRYVASRESAPLDAGGFARAHRSALMATALAGAIFLVIRFVLFPSVVEYGSYPGGSVWTGLATGIVAIGHYMRLLVVPHPLCADYRGVIASVTSLADTRLWMSSAAILALAYVAWRMRRTAPLFTWGVGMFFIGLLPVSNVVPIPMPVAERYLYLPFIGGVTALVAAAMQLQRTVARQVPARAGVALGVLVCAFAVLTWQRHSVWKDNERLWTATLADHPGSYGAMHGLAVVRLDQDRFDEAEGLLRRALDASTMEPRQRAGVLDDLGTTYASEGRMDQAVAAFTESLRLGESARTQYNLGVALILLDRIQEGEQHLRRSIEMNPYYARPYAILIELARQRGDLAEAARLERLQPSPAR